MQPFPRNSGPAILGRPRIGMAPDASKPCPRRTPPLRHGFDKLSTCASGGAEPREVVTQRATCSFTARSAPSFMGSTGTSLRHAPSATAATTAARTIALFIFSSPIALKLETQDYRATCVEAGTSPPSFIGSTGTSRRQAPTATAAMIVARTIAPFITCMSLSPDAYSAIAFNGLPVSSAQIKKRGSFPTAFPPYRCENATPDQHSPTPLSPDHAHIIHEVQHHAGARREAPLRSPAGQ